MDNDPGRLLFASPFFFPSFSLFPRRWSIAWPTIIQLNSMLRRPLTELTSRTFFRASVSSHRRYFRRPDLGEKNCVRGQKWCSKRDAIARRGLKKRDFRLDLFLAKFLMSTFRKIWRHFLKLKLKKKKNLRLFPAYSVKRVYFLFFFVRVTLERSFTQIYYILQPRSGANSLVFAPVKTRAFIPAGSFVAALARIRRMLGSGKFISSQRQRRRRRRRLIPSSVVVSRSIGYTYTRRLILADSTIFFFRLPTCAAKLKPDHWHWDVLLYFAPRTARTANTNC